MTQPSLFDSPAQRMRAPMKRYRLQETSRAAHDSIASETSHMRKRVLDYLRSCKSLGATDQETAIALKMNYSTVNPRRGELVERKLVAKSNLRRATLAGRSAIVWVAVDVAA